VSGWINKGFHAAGIVRKIKPDIDSGFSRITIFLCRRNARRRCIFGYFSRFSASKVHFPPSGWSFESIKQPLLALINIKRGLKVGFSTVEEEFHLIECV